MRSSLTVPCLLLLSAVLAACDPDAKDVDDTGNIPTDPTPGTVSGYAGANARSIDRGWRLVEVAAPVDQAQVAAVQD